VLQWRRLQCRRGKLFAVCSTARRLLQPRALRPAEGQSRRPHDLLEQPSTPPWPAEARPSAWRACKREVQYISDP